MSKLSKMTDRVLRMLFTEVQTEIDLSKLTNLLMKGIRVDFYIPEINAVVEVNGIQHYKASGFGKTKVQASVDYTKQLNRDSKLVSACNQYGIQYIEVDCQKVKTVNDLLKMFSEYKDVKEVVFNG